MNEDSKITEFLKKITDEQYSLRRLPVYFFLICVLLVVLIFKIGETNKKLEIIAEKAGAYIEYETKSNDPLEVFSEEQNEIEDVIPHFTEETSSDMTETELSENPSTYEPVTSSQTESPVKETMTAAPKAPIASNQKPQENTTVSSNTSSGKTTYVINKNSKKIHKSDCSYVDRMNESNKLIVTLSDAEHSEYLSNGYSPCSACGG